MRCMWCSRFPEGHGGVSGVLSQYRSNGEALEGIMTRCTWCRIVLKLVLGGDGQVHVVGKGSEAGDLERRLWCTRCKDIFEVWSADGG